MTRARVIGWSVIAAIMMVVPLVSASAQIDTSLRVSAQGVGKPPPGAQTGTKAALTNPKCNPDTVKGWGTFAMITANGGPFCVAAAPKNNGGATSRGVTRETIKVVVVTPAPVSTGAPVAQDRGSVNRATGQPPTVKAAILDAWAGLSHVYETWGRKVEFTFVESSGLDETAQRADAVKVEQEKPMFVLDVDSRGLETLATTLAKDKYVVHSYATTPQEAQALAPYLWGLFDSDANATNAAEFIGKQVVGGRARYAGDDSMHSQTRKFGVVYPEGYNLDSFMSTFQRYGGKLATPPLAYKANGSPLGDPTTAQEQAPTVISKLKAAGVTSVVLFTDIAMTGALTKAATKQELEPEWVMTGYQYQDVAVLARVTYDQDQFAHAFGISNLNPWIDNNTSTESVTALADWYWGPTQGSVATVTQDRAVWLAKAIHYAGPHLTPQNVARGLFAAPARGGAASNDPSSTQYGYGLTSGLSHPSYFNLGHDYAPVWYDPGTVGPSQGLDSVAQGVTWYVDGGKRYKAGTWPKKPLRFFDKSGAVVEFKTDPVPPGPPVPCTGCPSEGGPGSPSTA